MTVQVPAHFSDIVYKAKIPPYSDMSGLHDSNLQMTEVKILLTSRQSILVFILPSHFECVKHSLIME